MLPTGLIVWIAAGAGLAFPDHGTKRPLRCPFHGDRHPSAFLEAERNIFYCSVCTADGGWPARRFAEALGVPWPPPELRSRRPTDRPRRSPAFTFSAQHARSVWDMAFERARNDDFIEADMEVYDYLNRRGLAECFEEAAFGIVGAGMELPAAVASWPRSGHRLVLPLYDQQGALVNIQARTINATQPKNLFPRGSRGRETLFANAAGTQILRSDSARWPVVVLGEGLTDHLALTATVRCALVSSPGAGGAHFAIGPWVKGRQIVIAMDHDRAGDDSVDRIAHAAWKQGAARVQRLRWPRGLADACDVVNKRGLSGLTEFLEPCIGEERP